MHSNKKGNASRLLKQSSVTLQMLLHMQTSAFYRVTDFADFTAVPMLYGILIHSSMAIYFILYGFSFP